MKCKVKKKKGLFTSLEWTESLTDSSLNGDFDIKPENATSSRPVSLHIQGLMPCRSVGLGYMGGPTSSSVRHSEPFVIGRGKGTGERGRGDAAVAD